MDQYGIKQLNSFFPPHSSINGVPACANRMLLTDILRTEWGFSGYVISDDDAIENVKNSHHYTNSTLDTVAAAIKAGCNVELCQDNPYFPHQVQIDSLI